MNVEEILVDVVETLDLVDKRRRRVERAFRTFLEQSPVGEFAAKKAALDVLDNKE